VVLYLYRKSTFVIVYVIYIIGIAGLTLEGIKYTDLGSTTIGSYIEKREYTEYYYVNMFPDGIEDTNYRRDNLLTVSFIYDP